MSLNKTKIPEIINNVSKVIIGKREVTEKILVALLSGGHVLIEDVPGVGKTTLVHAISKSIGCSFKRIQFTPDLVPSDITGLTVYNMKSGEFEYRQGPIASNIILADEINRSSPKTQSSLLEAMQERQITVDGCTYKLPRPFMVLATQNPIEYEGTFPLPEAQLDRFTLRINIGYPNFAEEKKILIAYKEEEPLSKLQAVTSETEVEAMQMEVEKVFVDEDLQDYMIQITQLTRNHHDIYLGCSPRATLALFNAARALAYIRGREYVIPDDIKELVYATLTHRLILKSEAKIQGKDEHSVLSEIVKSIRVPVVKLYD
ncbi:MAG: AAA family ATPase [Clostridiales bacterium GWB2_37_7]|nr:MAG: AAA family ATPase [Clostridiales bacterium GWB2_37_7]